MPRATYHVSLSAFMPLPSFRSSRSKVRRRRSHHALKPVATATCSNCAATILPHRACKFCGFYKGRSIRKPSMAAAEKVMTKKLAKKAAPTEAEAPKKAKKVATKAKKTA